MYYKQIIAITFGVFCGTVIAFSVNFSSEIFLVSLFLFLVNFIIFKFKNRSIIQNHRVFSLALSVLFFGVSFGILLGQISTKKDLVKSERFNAFIYNKNILVGTIKEVKQKTNSQELVLEIKSETENEFNIKIITNNIPLHNTGETIEVEGKVSTTSIVLPPTKTINKSINLNNINKLLNISGEMVFPRIKLLSISKQNVFDDYLYKIKTYKGHFYKQILKTSSVHGASLGSGTLVGDSSLFTKEETDNFRISGLSHIVVASGFNVTIIIFILIYFLSFLKIKLKYRLWILIFCILSFMSFVGFSSSIVRAGLMAIVLIFSYMYGRGYTAKQSLFLVSLFMIIINPKISLYDISFHLSFLATFAILFIFPILQSSLKINLHKFKNNFQDKTEEGDSLIKKIFLSLYEIFLLTLSIQLITLPYVGFVFGYISIFGIFANILVLPILPLVMLFGFLTFLFSFSFYISSVFGFLLSIFSEYIFFISKIFSSFEYSKIEINLSLIFLVIYYFCLTIFLFFENKRKEIKKYLEK